jgi:hypothetical protein
MTVEDQIEALQKSATWEFHMAAAKSSQRNLDEARQHAHKAYNALDLIDALNKPENPKPLTMPKIEPITTSLAHLSHEAKALIAALPECDHAYPMGEVYDGTVGRFVREDLHSYPMGTPQ